MASRPVKQSKNDQLDGPLLGDQGTAGGGELVEAATCMRRAEGQRHGILRGHGAVAAVAVDLEHAGELNQVRDRPLGLTVGRVDIN